MKIKTRMALLGVCGKIGVISIAGVFASDCRSSAGEMPLPHVVCPRISAAPVIDGQLNDPCWGKAAKISEFVLTENGAKPREKTEAYLCYDDKNIYIGFKCYDSKMIGDAPVANLKVQCTEQDGNVFSDDCVEVFINPSDKPENEKDYYQFAVNPIGTRFDGKGDNVPGNYWNAFWKAQTYYKDANCWSAELAIPFFSMLGYGDSEPTGAWRINLCRENPKSNEYTAFSPTYGRFHTPGRFGFMDGIVVDGAKYRQFQLTGFSFGNYDPEQNVLGSKIKIANRTAEEKSVKLNLQVIPAAATPYFCSQVITLKAGTVTETNFPIKLQSAGKNEATLFLANPANDDILLALTKIPLSIPSFLSIKPDLNYYTREKNADILVEIKLDRHLLKNCSLTLELRKENESRALWNREITGLTGSEVLALAPIEALAEGKYIVGAKLVRNKNVVAQANQPLLKLKPSTSEVKINRDKAVVADGKPFFPFGMMSPPLAALKEVSDAGFNTVGKWRIYTEDYQAALSMPYAKDYYAAAQKVDLKVLDWLEVYSMAEGGGRSLENLQKAVNMTPSIVSQIKNEPALLGCFTYDEPDMSVFKQTQKMYKLYKENDPYHPVFPNFCGDIFFTEGWDIGCIDMYGALPKDSRNTYRLMDSWAQKVDHYKKIADAQNKPLWMILDSYTQGPLRDYTPAELRGKAYLVIIHGANAILYWNYKAMQECNWQELCRMAREMQKLAPILLSREVKQDCSVNPASVHVLKKEYGGKTYLICVNTRFEEAKAGFSLPGANISAVQEFLEERTIKPDGNNFQDTFPGYGVHVYEISRK